MIDRRWLMLLVLFVARCSYGYQFQSVGSSASWIDAELHVGYALIGTLIGLYTAPAAILSLPGGMVGARYGDRTVFVVGLLLMIAGGFVMSIADDVPTLAAGRVLSGAGAVLYNIVLTKLVTDWFAGREIVFAVGTLLSSWPVGIALGLILQGRVAESLGWRAVMAMTALLCLFSLILLLAFYRPPDAVDPPATAARVWWNPPDRQSMRSLLVICVAWGCFNQGIILMFSFGTSLLATRGMSALDAAAITSIPLWMASVTIPAGGYFLQRIARPRLVAALSYLAAAAALLALCLGASPILACIAFGLAIGPGPGAIMSQPARVLRPEHRITGLGINGAFFGIFAGAGPWIGGLLADAAGTPAAAVLLGAAMFTACVPLMMLFEATVRSPAGR